MNRDAIHVVGASQHNLKHLTLDIPLNRITVVTGVSGSGKSSLAFDTLYAEGQRRYVETFSPYARQFMDRMDRPQVERIEGIPPAIAIDSKDPVRTSRSTVGTMTEVTDYVKLLFARYGRLHCRGCGRPVAPEIPVGRVAVAGRPARGRAPRHHLPLDGRRVHAGRATPLPGPGGLRPGLPGGAGPRARGGSRRRTPSGRWSPTASSSAPATASACSTPWSWPSASGAAAPTSGPPKAGTTAFSRRLECAFCRIAYASPLPNLFSFNSPVGACDTCRGFGRIIDIDLDLIVPDPARSLAEGAIKPFGAAADGKPEYRDLVAFCRRERIPMDRPFRELTEEQRAAIVRAPRPITASRASSAGSRAAPTRCTCASSCRATAATTSARPAAGPASRPRRCSTARRPDHRPALRAARGRGPRVFRGVPAARVGRGRPA